MEVLIGILMIIILIVLLIPLVGFLLAIGVLALIVCGGGTALMFLSLYLVSVLKMWHLNSQGKMAEMIDVEFDGEKLSWFVDETMVKNFAKGGVAFFSGIMIGISSMIGLTFLLKETGGFKIDFYGKEVSEVVIVYIVSIISAIAFIVIIAKSDRNPKEIFENWMVKRANVLMSRVEKRVERIEDLHSLEDSIKSEATEMEATFPIDVQTGIQGFVDSHKMEILSDVTGLNKFISKKIEEFTNDLAELQKENDLYQAAMNLYNDTVPEVNRTGSIPLIKELEYDYEGLTSINLKALLSDRKWNEFSEVVNSIMRDLERLSELSLKYQEAGYKMEAEDYEGETDEERAYRILGVPSTASPEQIRNVYLALSLVYHGDKGIVEDDTRMKEINWAYHFLKDLKNFT